MKLMEGDAGGYIDSSRAMDTTQTDMKQSFKSKNQDAKKFAKVKNKHNLHYKDYIIVYKITIEFKTNIFVSGETVLRYNRI